MGFLTILGCIILITSIVHNSVEGERSIIVQIPLEGRETEAGGVKELRATSGPCTCEDDVCKCCTGVFMERLSQKGCVNLSYDPDEFAFGVRISMNDRTVYKNSVSGKNPRPMCVPLPRFPSFRMCVKLSNVYLVERNIHACVDMEGQFLDTSLFKMGLDCMRLGADGVALLRPEDGGGMGGAGGGEDYGPLEGEDYDVEGEGSVEEEGEEQAASSTARPVSATTSSPSSRAPAATRAPTTPAAKQVATDTTILVEKTKITNQPSAITAVTENPTTKT